MDRTDTQLVCEVGARLALPREAPADSFILHAGLELAARVGLLAHLPPGRREGARAQLVRLADQYDAWGPSVEAPSAVSFSDLDSAAAALVGALGAGDLDAVDGASRWLGRHASPCELRRLLAGPLVNRLGAAAHAPIFLYLLPRVAPDGEIPGELLRGLARHLGGEWSSRLHWVDGRPLDGPGEPGSMFDAIAATPLAPSDGATPFIHTTMARVDDDGTAAKLLEGVVSGRAVREQGREILRAAAWSMLLEPDDHSPYGWTHALTLPQAVLGVADTTSDPGVALAVAATYVVGFRRSLARRPLVPTEPDDAGLDLRAALGTDRATAAAAVWHVADDDRPDLVVDLAARASAHHDAHYVKYTLACLDAAADDPEHARLFLAAAGGLAGWWASATGA
ncbi:MAG TPA: hypothetical protein VFW06_08495 [Acidimicrobiia bacterium]|nr:hypothetical protein [Acidimicrobiia bacterium]